MKLDNEYKLYRYGGYQNQISGDHSVLLKIGTTVNAGWFRYSKSSSESNNAWVGFYDDAGNLRREWQPRIYGSNDYVSDLSSNSSDEVYAVWRATDPLRGYYTGGWSRTYLTKFSSAGSELWSKQLSAQGYNYPWSVETLSDGTVVVSGVTAIKDEWSEWIQTYDSNGNISWSYENENIEETFINGSNIYWVESSGARQSSERIQTLVHADKNGQIQWRTELETSYSFKGANFSDSGEIHLLASKDGHWGDDFIYKISSAGKALEKIQLDYNGSAKAFIFDGKDYILGGEEYSNSSLSIAIQKFNDKGKSLWKIIDANSEEEELTSINFDSTGRNINILGKRNSNQIGRKDEKPNIDDGIAYSFSRSYSPVNTDPTDLSISQSKVDENISDGWAVATLSTTDPDDSDTHTYSLVSGDGDADNSAFTIDGDQLKINESPDYETQKSYSVRLRTTDSGGLKIEKSFIFTVNNIKETLRSSTNKTLPTSIENLVLTGTGNLKGYGNSSNNRLTGNSGNNRLDGKAGIDVMKGNAGNDTYIVDNARDRVIEKANSGTDTIRSSVNETLSTNVENLALTGTGNLKGYGNSSNNRLTGNSGNNVLEGKAGRDILTGKGGGDKFRYRSTSASGITKSTRDIITDFESTESDLIDLSKIDAYTAKRGNQKFIYIGSDSFSGTQGEVRFASGILSMNTGTDTRADMQIKLNGVSEFSSDFLIL